MSNDCSSVVISSICFQVYFFVLVILFRITFARLGKLSSNKFFLQTFVPSRICFTLNSHHAKIFIKLTFFVLKSFFFLSKNLKEVLIQTTSFYCDPSQDNLVMFNLQWRRKKSLKYFRQRGEEKMSRDKFGKQGRDELVIKNMKFIICVMNG